MWHPIHFERTEYNSVEICDEDIEWFLDEIGNYEAAIEEWRGYIRTLKEELGNCLKRIYQSNLPDEQKKALFYSLYFEDDRVSALTIYNIFEDQGRSKTQLLRYLDNPSVEWQCLGCGHKWEVRMKDRDYLQSTEENPPPCPRCEKRENSSRHNNELEKIMVERDRQNRRLVELKRMPYVEYLQTPEWQETRKVALKRAKYHCQVCNGTGVLDVHHRTYERKGEERNDDLIVLCRKCHSLFHENGKVLKDLSVPYEVAEESKA